MSDEGYTSERRKYREMSKMWGGSIEESFN